MLKFRMSVLMIVATTFPVFGCGIPSQLPDSPQTPPGPAGVPVPVPPVPVPPVPVPPVPVPPVPVPPVPTEPPRFLGPPNSAGTRVISIINTVRLYDGRVNYSFSGPTPPKGALVWLFEKSSPQPLHYNFYEFKTDKADQWIGLPKNSVHLSSSIYIVLTESTTHWISGGLTVLATSGDVTVNSPFVPEPPRIYAYNALPYFPETDSYSDTPFFGGACTAGHTIEIRDVSMALKGSAVCDADGRFENVPSGAEGHIYLVFDLATGELGVSHMSTYGCDPADCKSDNYAVSTNGGLSASAYDPSSQTLSGSCVPGGVVSVQFESPATDIRERGSEFACPASGRFSRVVELTFGESYRLADFTNRIRSQPFSFNF